MHVLVIPSWYPQDEDPLLGIFFQEQAQAVKARGVRVGVVYPEVRPLKTLTYNMLKLNRFQHGVDFRGDIPAVRLHGWNLFPSFGRLQMKAWTRYAETLFTRYMENWGRPSLIHAHSFLWGGIAAASISEKWGIPFIVTEHRNHFVDGIALKGKIGECWTYPYIKKAAQSASKVIGVSNALTEVLGKYLEGKERLTTIPNSVDTDFFKPEASQGSLKKFQLITVAQLEERKNLPMLLRAFRRLLAERPEARLVILGEGPERRKLTEMAGELGIGQYLSMPGKVSREEVRRRLLESSAFLFSSDSESFGVALIEAMAAGLPVLSTRCGGPEEFVTQASGILVPKGDEESFYQGMVRLLKGSYQKEALHQYAKERFHSASVAERYITLYREAVAR